MPGERPSVTPISVTKTEHRREWNITVEMHNDSPDLMRRAEEYDGGRGAWRLQMELTWGYSMPQSAVAWHYLCLGSLQYHIGLTDMPACVRRSQYIAECQAVDAWERAASIDELRQWYHALPPEVSVTVPSLIEAASMPRPWSYRRRIKRLRRQCEAIGNPLPAFFHIQYLATIVHVR